MDIQQYIATQRANGLSDQQIIQALMASGWQPEQAQAALYGQMQPFGYAQQPTRRLRVWPLILMVLFVLIASGVAIAVKATQKDPPAEQNQTQNTTNTQEEQTPENTEEEEQDPNTAENDRRKSQVNFLVVSLTEYAANNSGKLPESTEEGWSRLTATISNREAITVSETGLELTYTSLTPQEGQIQYVRSAMCSEQTVIGAGSTRSFAVMIRLKDDTYYCQDNSSTNTSDETTDTSNPSQTTNNQTTTNTNSPTNITSGEGQEE